MHALGKSPIAKLSVRASAMARRWARARPHRLSFLLGGDDPENRIVEEIPAEGFDGPRHAVHVLCFASDFGVSGRKQETKSVTAKPTKSVTAKPTGNQVCHREAHDDFTSRR
jgi:hypothetical protein